MTHSLSASSPVTFFLIAALVVYAVARQLAPSRLDGRRLLMVPALCAFFALQQSTAFSSLDIAGSLVLVVGAATGIAAGALRGLSTRIWVAADGVVWTKGTWFTLATWVGMIAVRILAGVAAHFAGVPQGGMMADVVLLVGLSFGAQNAIVWLRAQQLVPAPWR